MELIKHIENYCGEIMEGWSVSQSGDDLPYQIIRTIKGPIEDTKTYVTLGLSNVPLQTVHSKKQIRQELVFVMKKNVIGLGVPSVMQEICSKVLDENRPLLRGDVLHYESSVFNGTTLEAIYVTNPVYFPDDFSACELDNGDFAAMCWLVPISRNEELFISENGWEAFEELLESTNPDLTDVFRKSII
jgi:hypothetical protein